MRRVLAITAVALAGCNAPAPVQGPSAAEIFGLRTECGKLGEAWLLRHPLPRESPGTTEAAKIYYVSGVNRCWVIVSHGTYRDRKPRNGFWWPAWAADAPGRKFTYEDTDTLHDAQTGALIMSCRRVDFRSPVGDDDCVYIGRIWRSDL